MGGKRRRRRTKKGRRRRRRRKGRGRRGRVASARQLSPAHPGAPTVLVVEVTLVVFKGTIIINVGL
jgi:hypothetical protein